MPEFKDAIVTSPDGVRYKVRAPKDASEQDIIDRARAKAASDTIQNQYNISPMSQGPGPAAKFFGNIGLQAVQNAPASAAQFVADIARPLQNPIEAYNQIKNIGRGVLQQLGVVSGDDAEQYAEQFGEYLVNRYGSGAAIAHTMATDPVGLLADFSTVVGGGAGAIPGKVGQVARAAGRATNPIGLAGRAARPLLTEFPSEGVNAARIGAAIPGVTTGQGAETYRIGAQAGFEGGKAAKAFRDQMTGAAPVTEIVSDAKQAMARLRFERGEIYRQEMAKIGGDKTILDFADVDKAVNGTIKKFGKFEISSEVADVYQKMQDKVAKFKQLAQQDPQFYQTAAGFDALKMSIGEILDTTEVGTPAYRAADDVYNSIKDTIVKQNPKYAKIMEGYETASAEIKEIEKTLSVNPKATVDTSLRKIVSVLRDNVNTNYGQRRELVAFLARSGATHLLEKIAGQSTKQLAPRGLAGILAGGEAAGAIGTALTTGDYGKAASIAATMGLHSPRLMGTGAYGLGAAARYAPKVGLGFRALGQIPKDPIPYDLQ